MVHQQGKCQRQFHELFLIQLRCFQLLALAYCGHWAGKFLKSREYYIAVNLNKGLGNSRAWHTFINDFIRIDYWMVTEVYFVTCLTFCLGHFRVSCAACLPQNSSIIILKYCSNSLSVTLFGWESKKSFQISFQEKARSNRFVRNQPQLLERGKITTAHLLHFRFNLHFVLHKHTTWLSSLHMSTMWHECPLHFRFSFCYFFRSFKYREKARMDNW